MVHVINVIFDVNKEPIMNTVPVTRKRSRGSEEEDFLPLSKKINNLHINKYPYSAQPQAQWPPAYNPDLTPEQSCYYYDNKLLYELYLSRVHRNGLLN